MKNYLDLAAHVMANGVDVMNERTGEVCRTVVGEMLKFDMRDGFPAMTTKKLAFKSGFGEMRAFWRGADSAAIFREMGCKFWDKNANETEGWLNNPLRIHQGHDFLGKIYGWQWTRWRDWRIVDSLPDLEIALAKGYRIQLSAPQYVPGKGNITRYLIGREINQLEENVRTILKDPTNRGIIMTAWRPDEFDQMALRPCHVDYRWTPIDHPNGRKELHLTMTMRSTDVFLGLPVNISNCAIFLSIMASLTSREAATLTVQLTDTHIYQKHFTAVEEQLSRDIRAKPELILSENIRPIQDEQQIRGVFERLMADDVRLVGYAPHPAIEAEMAA